MKATTHTVTQMNDLTARKRGKRGERGTKGYIKIKDGCRPL